MRVPAVLFAALLGVTLGAQPSVPPIVFVSRAIPPVGTIYWSYPGGMPGVSGYSRFEVAAPGQLLVRESSGQIRVLVDGNTPASTPFRLVDVNAPDVSWDGQRIVFAGLPEGSYPRGPLMNPGAWRLYAINLDGSGLTQITRSDRTVDLGQFGNLSYFFAAYDDTDPAWLPDGRIVFSSSRFPGFGQYSAARSTQLYVVNNNGTGLHRITGEKNGADRPRVDPLTGRIVYSRWWRNFRFPAQDMTATVLHPEGGYRQHNGLVSASDDRITQIPGGRENPVRNSWPLASINPDGTDLRQFAGVSGLFFESEDLNHAYGGSFAPDGSLYANFFPMKNGTEASGFGGIRRYQRGPGRPQSIVGITSNLGQVLARPDAPQSYGVYAGAYAADPDVLPDGRLVISHATGVAQDYGLAIVNADGTGLTPLHDIPARTELRARVALPRGRPPVIPDRVTAVAAALPPLEAPPYDSGGTFVFDAQNVYFNAPVDVPIISAPGMGTARTIRFFGDWQRRQPGSIEREDWPILLNTVQVRPDGSIPPTAAPADLPLFEQLRSAGLEVPLTGRGNHQATRGAAHVNGMNFGRAGEVMSCVGCHAGHSMIPVPPTREAARWTNLAPGASLRYSSIHPAILSDPQIGNADGLVDRQARTGRPEWHWRSDPAQPPDGQWVALDFPAPIRVRTVRLWGPATGLGVESARVTLSDGSTQLVGRIAETGTEVSFADVLTSTVRVELVTVTGQVASLAEVEIIGRVEDANTPSPPPAPSNLRISGTP